MKQTKLMKTLGLQLGNWLLHKSGIYIQVKQIGKNYVGYYIGEDYKIAMVETIAPIQITEEILIKAGFTEKSFHGCISLFFEEHNFNFAWFSEPIKYHEKGLYLGVFEADGACDTLLPHIQYVHQFQNLYNDLTEKELEITL